MLAVGVDELVGFHSDFETTRYPAEHLWGPGGYEEAISWLSSSDVEPGEIDPLDRWFVVRAVEGRVDPARNIHQFAGLSVDQRGGKWHLVQADYPMDAFVHVRSAEAVGGFCVMEGPCDQCWTDTKVVGDWATIEASLSGLQLTPRPSSPIGARVECDYAGWEIWGSG